MYDNIKRDRILGLVVGLIGLVALFYFDFDNFEFTSREIGTPMRYFLGTVAGFNGWVIFQPLYLALVWFFRGRIGHWTIKIVQLAYKKI